MIIAIQRHCKSFTPELQLIPFCMTRNIPFVFIDKPEDIKDDHVPYASVDLCNKFLGLTIRPTYFPSFIPNEFIGRRYWETEDKNIPINTFIKPSDSYKRFTGYVYTGENTIQEGPLFCQEIVKFKYEFRQYIIKGQVLCSYWYSDCSPCITPPMVPIEVPADFCGTLDFGITDKDKILLIESHLPYSIGWYGPQEHIDKYVEFMVEGWKYMKFKYRV